MGRYLIELLAPTYNKDADYQCLLLLGQPEDWKQSIGHIHLRKLCVPVSLCSGVITGVQSGNTWPIVDSFTSRKGADG